MGNFKKIIYFVINSVTGEKYIGASGKTMAERKQDHHQKARKRVGSKFQNAIASYPPEAFEWEEIDTACSSNELAEKEKQYITQFRAKEEGYNSDRGGGFQKNIYQYDIESGVLLSSYPSLEDAAGAVEVDRKTSSKACLGEIKNCAGYSWSYSLSENYKPEEDKRKKKVFQFYFHGEFVQSYNSVPEASEVTGIIRSSIAKCCRGVYKNAGEYYWDYED